MEYKVRVRCETVEVYIVEADTEGQALRAIRAGQAQFVCADGPNYVGADFERLDVENMDKTGGHK